MVPGSLFGQLRSEGRWRIRGSPYRDASAGSNLPVRAMDSPRDSPVLSNLSNVVYGETADARTVFTVVALICIFCLAAMLGCRARQLKLDALPMMNLIRLCVVMMYISGTIFVFAAAIVEIGLGLATVPVCEAAIYVCLIFYMSAKLFMYIFLIERVHILRSPYSNRARDWIWLAGMLSLIVGFGTIGVIGFIYPMADLGQEDGKCRIGLPLKVSIPLLTFDVIINVALTVVFIYLLRPLLTLASSDQSSSWMKKIMSITAWALGIEERTETYVHPSNRVLLKRVKTLLWKSLIGASLILFPTMANLTVLYVFQGRELGWLCFTICSIDITWGVGVVHWLTTDPMEMDGRAPSVMTPDTSSTATSLGVRC